MTDETSEETNYSEWTGDELREELRERGLSTTGKNAEMAQRLTDDDASEDVTTVADLPDEVKTGPVLRREERAERVAGEAAAYERQHEVTTPQQSGVFADVAEQQAAEARGEVRERERE